MPPGTRRVLGILLVCAWAGPASAATSVSGNLGANPHWTLAGSPYQLTNSPTLAAGATLTIDPGVQVVAMDATPLTLAGTLAIAASSANPVVFSPDAHLAAGSWPGVIFPDGASAEVTGAIFSQASTDVTIYAAEVSFASTQFVKATHDGVLVGNAAHFSAQDCTFWNNARRGLYVETVYPQGAVSNSVFRANGEYPIWAKANCLDMLGAGLQFYKNHFQTIAVSCSASTDIQRPQTWHSQPIPLDLTPGSTKGLVIPAGVSLTMGGPLNLICRRVDVAGTLRLGDGTAKMVYLAGPAATPGSWEGIHVSSGGEVDLNQARVAYATTGITADDATVNISASRLLNCQYDALSTTGNSTVGISASYVQGNGRYGLSLAGQVSGNVTNNQFSANGSYPVFALAANVAALGTGNAYTGNAKNAIGVSCALEPDIPASATWNTQGVPFDLTANPAGTVLSVGPKAVLTLPAGATLWGGGVDVHGRLDALASTKRPVSFLPPGAAAPGSWQGITFYAGSGGRLRWCHVYYAQTGVTVQTASPRLEYTEVRYSAGPGLSCSGTAAPILYHCRVSDNGGVGVYALDAAAPDLGDLSNAITYDDGGNTLMGNTGYDLRNESTANLMAQNNYWGTVNQSTVQAHIWDGHDQPGVGTVNFLPLATSASPAPLSGACGPALAGLTAVQAPGGRLEIRVRLLAPAWVSLRVVNLAGRLVCQVLDDAPAGVGERVVLWSGRSGHGERLPAGRYLLQVTANGTDGSTARQTVPVTLSY